MGSYVLIFLALSIQYFDIRFKLFGLVSVFFSLTSAGWSFTGDDSWTTLGRACRPPPLASGSSPRPASAHRHSPEAEGAHCEPR